MPFVFPRKKSNILGSKQSTTLNNFQEYRINKFRYKQNKDSYLNLVKVYKIPFYKIKNKHKTLNDVDLKNIQKRLNVNKSSYKLIENIYILEGDVIESENQLFYVYSTDNVYVYCFFIFKKYPKELSNIQKKEHIKKNNKMTYESGTIFQVGKAKMVYLYKANNKYYGVNALMYKIKPRVMPIYNIHKNQILGIVPKEDYLKMLEYLYLNNVQPLKEIRDLYNDLRNIVYSA